MFIYLLTAPTGSEVEISIRSLGYKITLEFLVGTSKDDGIIAIAQQKSSFFSINL